MNVLKNHLEKVVFGVVVAICAVFAYSSWQGSVADTTDMAGLEDNRDKIKRELDKGNVTDKYPYFSAAADKVKYKETFEASLERGTKKAEEEIPAYVAYPMLPRPYVDPAGKPATDDELTKHEYAEVSPLGEVKAEGDHGRVFLTFKLPSRMKHMDPVRVEVFRGVDAKQIDLGKPYGTVELGPEEKPEASAAAAAAAARERDAGAAAPEKAAEEGESAADRRRRERREAEAKGAPKAREKKEKATEEIPAEFADLKVFSDTRVDPRKTYYYQARLVSRMSVPEGRRFEARDATGHLTKIVVVHGPKSTQTLPGAKSGVVLYTTPLSEVVSATTPDNFQIRLAGFSGKVDPPGTPEYKRTKEYKARFAVRVWVVEAQAWEKKDLEIAPDDLLKGTLTYKPAGSEESKPYGFDSGYKLIELKQESMVRETEVEQPKVGPDGNLVIDPATKQPVKEKRTIKSEPIPVVIAVLENLQDKKLEEFPERADFEARKTSLGYYAKISERQQLEKKALQKPPEKK